MRLELLHPVVCAIDCKVCLVKQMDIETGRINTKHGKELDRFPIEVGIEFQAECRKDPINGCPKGTPENPKTLWPENELCYEHYLECKATGRFPDDPLVHRNAAAIAGVEQSAKRKQEVEFQSTLLTMLVKNV